VASTPSRKPRPGSAPSLCGRRLRFHERLAVSVNYLQPARYLLNCPWWGKAATTDSHFCLAVMAVQRFLGAFRHVAYFLARVRPLNKR
jgi:hypothetical protein